MNKSIILTAIAVALGSAFATDWSQYPAGQPVVLGAGDHLVTDADFATFNALGIVTLDDENAVLTFSLTGDEKTLTHPVVGRGKMVKDGSGVLAFGAMGHPDVPNNGKVDDSSYQDFHTTNGIDIVAGTLKFPQGQGKRGRFGHITMAANTTLYLINDGATIITSLNGDGAVINTSATAQEFRIGNAPSQSGKKSVYRGVISGGVDLRCDCYTELLNPENSFVGNVTAVRNTTSYDPESRGLLAVRSFGMKNKKSAAGAGTSVTSCFNGWFRYLGDGETTDRTFFHDFPWSTQELLFDAGATGGLVFTGSFNIGNNDRSLRYTLTGSNAVNACTFEGPVKVNSGNSVFPFYLTKAGTGIWRLNENANHRIYGPIAVQEGTLQFETIAETNEFCSLGSACMLYDAPPNRTDLKTEAACEPYKVDYSLLIGGGANPTLEYVGSGKSVTTTRKIALAGDVARISFKPEGVESPSVVTVAPDLKTISDAETRTVSGELTLAGGVSSLTEGSRKLVLDGDGSSGLATIANVSDGAGVVGVEKRGAGNWTVAGTYSATGPVVVREGTLDLAAPKKLYRWYRYTILETSTATSFQYLKLLGLYDAAGNGYSPVMTNLWPETAVKDGVYQRYCPHEGLAKFLKPGECTVAFGNDVSFYMAQSPSQGFKHDGFFYCYCRPAYEDQPNTHMTIVFRLPDDAPAIRYYDVCQIGNNGANEHMNKFMLEASVDGESWVELHRETTVRTCGADCWNSTGIAWKEGQNCLAEGATFGYEIPTGPVVFGSAPSLASASGVAVAKNATLASDGTSEIASLTLDAGASDGMGTIKGFTFSQQGSLYITNLPEGVSGRTVAVSFVDCAGLQNLSSWTVFANGREKHGWAVKATTTGVSFQKPGLMILFK